MNYPLLASSVPFVSIIAVLCWSPDAKLCEPPCVSYDGSCSSHWLRRSRTGEARIMPILRHAPSPFDLPTRAPAGAVRVTAPAWEGGAAPGAAAAWRGRHRHGWVVQTEARVGTYECLISVTESDIRYMSFKSCIHLQIAPLHPTGERLNLILWARSSAFRAAAAFGHVDADGYPRDKEQVGYTSWLLRHPTRFGPLRWRNFKGVR